MLSGFLGTKLCIGLSLALVPGSPLQHGARLASHFHATVFRTHPPSCKSETGNGQTAIGSDDERQQLVMPKAHFNDMVAQILFENLSQSVTLNFSLNVKVLCITSWVWLVTS